jgi:hypothetical protein
MCLGQEPDPCEDYLGDEADLVLCRDYFELIAERDLLLKTQQEWNNSAANNRRSHYDARIQRLETKLAGLTGNTPELEAHLERKIADLIRLRDAYDSTEEGGPRDRAGKLGPQISALNKLINQIKQDLGL